MKKLIVTLLLMLVVYVIYYDLSKGVLTQPTSFIVVNGSSDQTNKNTETNGISKEIIDKNTNAPKEDESNQEQLYYKEVQVTAGQTVLSIVEQIHNGPLPVSIAQLITDFQILNPKTEPERIQIGKVYKFPVYSEIVENTLPQ